MIDREAQDECAAQAAPSDAPGAIAVPSWCRGLVLLLCITGQCNADFPFYQPIKPPRSVQVMAHRGAAGQAPENSRSALARCIEDGMEWAEVDVRLTRDGRHILAHDATVLDAGGTSRQISEQSWDDLSTIDVGATFAPRFAKERLLALNDCLGFCKGRLNLYLDCKAVNAELLVRDIVAAEMEEQVVVYADLPTLQRVKEVSRGRVAIMAKWHLSFGGADWAARLGLAAVEVDAPELTGAVAGSFHRAGIKVQAKVLDEWDTPAVWEQAIVAGADWLQTDLPEEVLAHALWRRIRERPVQIAMHRGANRYAPENTLPAFAKAVRLGADYVEFDVRATRDGAFHLLHDSRLNRTTDGSGPIDEIAADALGRIDAGARFGRPFAHTRIPELDDFLRNFAGKVGFYFDAKAISPKALAEALDRYQVVDRTVVYQSPDFLSRLKAINPRIRALPPLGRPEDLDRLAASLKPYGVDADWDILSKGVIARCHALGIRVFSDALGEHERIDDYLQAMEWGIDVIQTDHPLRVFRAIELWPNGKAVGRNLPGP